MHAFRYRLTVRRLMIAVGDRCHGRWGSVTSRRRRAFCLARAAEYANRAQVHRRLAEEERPGSARLAALNQELADGYDQADHAYRRSASRPWEALPRVPVSLLSPERLSELGDD